MATRFTPDFDQMECERNAARKERDEALKKLAEAEKERDRAREDHKEAEREREAEQMRAAKFEQYRDEVVAKLAQAEKERDKAKANWRMAVKNGDFEANRALERQSLIEELRVKLWNAEKQRDDARAEIEDVEADRVTLTAGAKLWSDAKDQLRRERDAFKAQLDAACAEICLLRAGRGRPSDMEQFEASDLVARLRREKLAILADYAAVLATVCEDNPDLDAYLGVLEGVSEQMTETVRDLKEGAQ